MIHLWRLSTVIDCGTINWDKRVLLWFQLSEYDVEPQDTTLPIYKQFAKTPYGWLITIDVEKTNSPTDISVCYKTNKFIMDIIGKDMVMACDINQDRIKWFKEKLINRAWSMFDLEIDIWEYQWKPIYNVISATPSNVEDTFEWWVDVKTFLFTDETILSDINALGFDNKHVKNSDEYNILKQKTLDSEEIPF